MSEKLKRQKARERLMELLKEVEPAKNEEIAREAIRIACQWVDKAENQAIMFEQYQREKE